MTFIINEPTVSSRDFMLYIHTYIYMPHIVSYIADLIFDLVCVGACIYIYICMPLQVEVRKTYQYQYRYHQLLEGNPTLAI